MNGSIAHKHSLSYYLKTGNNFSPINVFDTIYRFNNWVMTFPFGQSL